MKSQFILVCFLLVVITQTLKAQQLQPLEIIPFDSEQYEKMLRERSQMDSLILPLDTLSKNTTSPYSMRILDVPQNSMAKMPNMPINPDVHYHMQIKAYENCNPPPSQKLEYRFLPDNKEKK